MEHNKCLRAATDIEIKSSRNKKSLSNQDNKEVISKPPNKEVCLAFAYNIAFSTIISTDSNCKKRKGFKERKKMSDPDNKSSSKKHRLEAPRISARSRNA